MPHFQAEQERLKEALRLGWAARMCLNRVPPGSFPRATPKASPPQMSRRITWRSFAPIWRPADGDYPGADRRVLEQNRSSLRGTRRARTEDRTGRTRAFRPWSVAARESFVGRQAELQAIRDYLQNDSPWPLVVHGASGCGKTALLARAAEEMQKSEVSGQKPEVIVRFIGVTPRSSDIRSLLGSLCQELRLRHPREGELPTDIKALRQKNCTSISGPPRRSNR